MVSGIARSTEAPLRPSPDERRSPVVRLDSVSKSYRSADGALAPPVLVDVDLRIEPGEKASLIGPSGSGKSTLLSLIAGLLTPDDGSVMVDGQSIADLDDRARARLRAKRIGIALQSDNLIPFLSARENIELAARFESRRFQGRRARRHARRRALELLERFGVADRADHRPRQLSGGEAQRVALAVALANEPAVLLADEVVGQLDSDTAGRVVGEVLAGDFAVLYVTHDEALADQVDSRYRLDGHRLLRR